MCIKDKVYQGEEYMKKARKHLMVIFIVIAILFSGTVYVINWAFYDIQRINGHEYINQVTSPNGKYTVTAYLNNGGATTSLAVLGILKNNENGKIKNIYWQYRCDIAEMEWLSDETIKINGIELNVKKDVYDYRRKRT
jgi:Family of unknown function (DUF5412)